MSVQPGDHGARVEIVPMEVDEPLAALDTDELLAQLASLADGLGGAGIDVRSRYNPSQLLNNCSIVTMAYLTGTDARSLLTRIGVPLDPNSPGLSLQQIQAAGERAGVAFAAHNYSERLPNNGGPVRTRTGAPEAVFTRRARFPRRRVGVAYRRPNGSGHVVTVANAGTQYRRYMDYQARTAGQDVTAEVKRSRIYMAFYFNSNEAEPMEVDPENLTVHDGVVEL